MSQSHHQLFMYIACLVYSSQLYALLLTTLS